MCDHFVITESGFSKTAVAYNLLSPRVFLYTRLDRKGMFHLSELPPCDQTRPYSLLHFSRWSGL